MISFLLHIIIQNMPHAHRGCYFTRASQRILQCNNLKDICSGVSACATLTGALQRQFGPRKDRVTEGPKPVFRLARRET